MTQDDIRGFVNRDWAGLGTAKAVAWQAGKRTAADDLHAADQLRQYVLSVRPGWPSPDDRAADLSNHLRVSEALGAIAIRPR